MEVLTSHCLPAVHHGFVLLIELAEKVCGPPSIGEEDRVTLQDIQDRYFEITDDWAAEDPKQQWHPWPNSTTCSMNWRTSISRTRLRCRSFANASRL